MELQNGGPQAAQAVGKHLPQLISQALTLPRVSFQALLQPALLHESGEEIKSTV